MRDTELFVSFPIWVIFTATLLLTLLAVEAGYQFARHKRRAEVESEAPVGAMVGAMLGLLAFILGVTFSLAFNRFHDRRVALLREANAIRMTYLQAGVIPEPHRSEVRRIVRDYADERLQWAGVEKVNVRSSANELLNQLWAQAAVVGSQNPGTADVFLRSVSKVIDLNTTRLMLRDRSHIPTFFWFALYLLAILSLASMGYHGGVAGTNRSPVTIAVAIAFSVVIMMIADVDRPGEGFIDVNQQPMIDTRDFVNASKP
jgi:hypothetical protein